ncbi:MULTISPECIES: TetR/AcrR family transcriptional regulator [Bacillus]|uniref:TetR/AcrR family transcriptional regulator n=1 Tax=Bacillus TaxID=1386 RepID=UPI0004627242|nr:MULTISPECIES: TetR/AcrR family transcriptional regulator [Bacillus]PNU23931.1 TetR family transcriptional regulator [Bacillus stratosphericus]APJ12059.1 TetR family transcriptional regulator [Bacillus safensis]AYJ90697.1 TetR/AcrR family transcriptional regulator [Bacillus safensis]KAB3541120.1 TetR/AcrR family transcriptional regulator [Bacillus safensis]KAB3546363.1 TetR/AcrR family transcriptional regulator [Bacillus safensis]
MKQKRPKYMQIIDAAVVVIAENGYHQSQVSKIAKQAGVADGTIYLYFKNKEDILISLFKEKMGQFIERMETDIQKKPSAKEKLLLLIEEHFRMLAQNHHLALVTQLELRQSNLELRQKINEVLKGYLNMLESILTEGKKTGEFRQNLDVRLARQMVFGTIDETATTWVMNDQKYDLPALAESVHDLLLNGIHQS